MFATRSAHKWSRTTLLHLECILLYTVLSKEKVEQHSLARFLFTGKVEQHCSVFGVDFFVCCMEMYEVRVLAIYTHANKNPSVSIQERSEREKREKIQHILSVYTCFTKIKCVQ